MTNSMQRRFVTRVIRAAVSRTAVSRAAVSGVSAALVLVIFAALALVTVPRAVAQTYMFNRSDFATGQGPETVAVGDFNGDGRMDVVVGNTLAISSSTISVLLGKADGTFAPAVDYTVNGNPYSVAVGDFNGDGKLDIAIADNLELTEGVDVMLGNGDGTFKAPVTYATANDPRMVVVADFNGDGKLDLATINDQSETVSILLGTGTGTFGAHTDFPTKQEGCISIGAGDLRNKGLIDLVAGCQTLGQVVVLLGNGNGTVKTPKDYAVPAGADMVALGDFNGDGKLDVAVTNGASTGSVSVLTRSEEQ